VLAALLAAMFLGAAGNAPVARADTAAPSPVACPSALADKARCYSGRDANGAYYASAVPRRWNGSLVVHAHGGPDLGAASGPSRSTDETYGRVLPRPGGQHWPAMTGRQERAWGRIDGVGIAP